MRISRKRKNVPLLTQVNNRDYFNFSYKLIDESMGPAQDECPVGILRLLDDTDSEYGADWRNRCMENHKKRKNPTALHNLPVGARISYTEEDGSSVVLEKHRPAYQFKRKAGSPTTEEDMQWMKAVTVHRLIGARPYTDDNLQYTFHKNHKLPKGLYIVDEASMLDEKLSENFLQAVPDGFLVVFTGDPDQLLSVDTGTVLKDIIDSDIFRVFRLTQIHRQSGKNRIVANYKKILKRDTSLEQGEDFQVIRVQTDEEIIKNTAVLYKKYQSPSPYGFQILTCTKKYLTGKDSINQMIASARHTTNHKFEVSDRIMMDSNNYRENYWNGDVGTIMRMHADGADISFYDGTRFIKRDCFKDMEHAWACTIHKSQGSEYDVTCVILDGQCESLMHNRMILTAVTRAKEICYIVTKGDALERCIKSVSEIIRYTGLVDMLKDLA